MAAVELYLFQVEGDFNSGIVTGLLDAFEGRGVVTIFDALSIFGTAHISSAYMHAARAILRGRNRAREHSLEVMRWAAGSRQVGEGMRICGPSGSTETILVGIALGEWPREGDDVSEPELRAGVIDDLSEEIGGLIPLHFGSIGSIGRHLGGRKALPRLGLEGCCSTAEEMELAVLERVASVELS